MADHSAQALRPRRAAAAALLLSLFLLLAACAAPTPQPLRPTSPPETAVPPDATSTPTAPPPTPTPFPEVATAVAAQAAAEPSGPSCADAVTGRSMPYAEALAIAAASACVAEGELLDARLCNEGTGTWWIGLDAPRPGCNPACVVHISTGTAEINWRCSGLAAPEPTTSGPTATPAPSATPAESTPMPEAPPAAETATPAPDRWSGLVQRAAAGTQVAYELLPDDGQAALPLRAAGPALQDALADAAWRGAPLALRGDLDPQTGALLVTAVLSAGAPAEELRNMAPFAFPSASSAAPPDSGGTYDAWSAVDGRLGVPWCEGREGPGVGEWLQLDFSAPLQISELRLSNGFDQDGFLYETNDQVARATLTFDEEQSLSWDFAIARGLQIVPILPPVTTQSLRLTIEAVTPGWSYEDACIGEIEVWGIPE